MYHPMGTHKNEEPIKKMIVDGYRRGVCTADGGDIPLERRGMAGKGSHYVGQAAITALQKQTSIDEMLERMMRCGIISRKNTRNG